MPEKEIEQLRAIKTLSQLIVYLRDELEWPVEAKDVEDMTFDYEPEELGFDAATAVKIKEIKQLRPLAAGQPWGIFWINFEKKRLPVVMLRRILAHLVIKKRASANRGERPAWHTHDLLFISAYGEEADRAVTFAHFWHDPQCSGDLPVLQVLGWDGADTVLHLADAHRTLAEKLRWPEKPADAQAWRDQWASAFTLLHREVITTTQELVEELAKLATAIRRRANSIVARESARGPMRQLYAAFQKTLIHDLTEDDFADIIAQTISYGLLAARFSRPAGICVQNLVDMVPPTNPFLKELLEVFLSVAGKGAKFNFDELGIQDVVELLNRANAEAVKTDFGNRTRNEDPVIHFYEHFLKAYDNEKKVQRGVFYTPQPVVSYIVRSVHELLQAEFGLEDGLASTTTWGEMAKRTKDLKIPSGTQEGEFFVNVLDPATGTATFLVEVIEVIFRHLQAKWDSTKGDMPVIPGAHPGKTARSAFKGFKEYWNAYVPKALLPRLYGYELMMAPYTIAHLKLALKLSEINARLGQPDYLFKYQGRAHIYLTNALEPASDVGQAAFSGMVPALAHEAQAVNAAKRLKRFTVVIGNPPYSKLSSNSSSWINDLLHGRGADLAASADYYSVDGAPLGERTVWIQDDYIKFTRLSQWHIERSGTGIHAYISNNGYLDNPTLRGMRQQLTKSFDRIYALDLHGSTKRGEKGPDDAGDQNVFDIQQGVAIGVFLKRSSDAPATVYHADLWGDRESKYHTLGVQRVLQLGWSTVQVSPPFYLYVPTDSTYQAEYDSGSKVTDIFSFHHCGFITKRDSLTIHWTANDTFRTVSDFAALSPKAARDKYQLPADVRDWKVEWAQSDLRNVGISRNRVIPVLYRPFDIRFTYFTGRSRGFVGWPVAELTKEMLPGNNMVLVTTRMTKGEHFQHALVSRHMAEVICLSAKTSNNGFVFPLYLNFVDGPDTLFRETMSQERPNSRKANLKPGFCKQLEDALGLKFSTPGQGNVASTFGPEDAFRYVLAVLQCPAYRRRYVEFLSRDFPRIPLPGSLDFFRAIGKLGAELVTLHLVEFRLEDEKPKSAEQKGWPAYSRLTEFTGKVPSIEVEKVSYSRKTVWLDKDQTVGFKGVPENVWEFHIGGYQVCEKWLKDRKGRRLSAEDVQHYHKIVVALHHTIRLMAEIDKVIEKHGGWPGAFVISAGSKG